MLVATTLLSSPTPLVYGAGCAARPPETAPAVSGAPALNAVDHTFYFTGRSDNFDPTKPSSDPKDARFDSESIRVSNDRVHVYISDEYGPYVYEFDRLSGKRTRVFTLPAKFAVPHPHPTGAQEIPPPGGTSVDDLVGRVANKGMEGLAITPDGKMLVGAMQSPLIQDGGNNLVAGQYTRIVTIDIATGVTHEYSYPLDGTTKTTVSDILAVNDHEFLVDERDSKGRADSATSPSAAGFKRLYEIDLNGATDVSAGTGQAYLAARALRKTLFLDVVNVLTSDPLDMDAHLIPAKLEGIAFGEDVMIDGVRKHTLYVGNDNDFLAVFPDPNPGAAPFDNSNQWFVFSFTDSDLPGYVPQHFEPEHHDDRSDWSGREGHDRN